MATGAPPGRGAGPLISLIAAIAANGVIGRNGGMPWRIPDDTARFKRLTMGSPVIMGRATWLSLRRPLGGRVNIVLSRDQGLSTPGATVVHSRDEALAAAAAVAAAGEAFVIGGAAVYALFLPVASRMYLTWVDAEVPGDTVFPAVEWQEWRIVRETTAEPADGSLPHRFADYERTQE